MEDGCYDQQLICLDVDFHTAMAITYVLLKHTEKVFKELPKAGASTTSTGRKAVRRQMFLDKLPAEFDRQTFIDIAASLGIPLSTSERNIKQWCEKGLLEHLDQGKIQEKSEVAPQGAISLYLLILVEYEANFCNFG